MPVSEFEISCTVPLDNFHGRQLLLPFGKGSGLKLNTLHTINKHVSNMHWTLQIFSGFCCLSFHTCAPHILCTRPGSWWSRRWSSCLSPPPGGPGLQLWRTLYFDRCGTDWGLAPKLWSDTERSDLVKRPNTWNKGWNLLVIFFAVLINCLLVKMIYCSHHEHTRLLAVHKAFRNRVWSEDFIPNRNNLVSFKCRLRKIVVFRVIIEINNKII